MKKAMVVMNKVMDKGLDRLHQTLQDAFGVLVLVLVLSVIDIAIETHTTHVEADITSTTSNVGDWVDLG